MQIAVTFLPHKTSGSFPSILGCSKAGSFKSFVYIIQPPLLVFSPLENSFSFFLWSKSFKQHALQE